MSENNRDVTELLRHHQRRKNAIKERCEVAIDSIIDKAGPAVKKAAGSLTTYGYRGRMYDEISSSERPRLGLAMLPVAGNRPGVTPLELAEAVTLWFEPNHTGDVAVLRQNPGSETVRQIATLDADFQFEEAQEAVYNFVKGVLGREVGDS